VTKSTVIYSSRHVCSTDISQSWNYCQGHLRPSWCWVELCSSHCRLFWRRSSQQIIWLVQNSQN